MILNTRPRERQAYMYQRFKSEVIASPMLEAKALPWNDKVLDGADAIVLTSQAAIELSSSHFASTFLPVYAVGSATAQAARCAGFHEVTHATGTAESLLNLIDSVDFESGAYLSARHVACDLALERPQRVVRHIVYEMRPVQDLPAQAINVIASGSRFIVPFYSPRALEVFEHLISRVHLESCLTQATAVLIHSRLQSRMTLMWGRVLIAERPDNESVINSLHKAA